ncbi:MAG: DUF551 domain-containing protein [Eubacterium ventriosum]
MRLIDADLFEKEIKAVAQGQATSLMPDMVELSVETIVETLDEVPTAYDVDNVMQTINNKIKTLDDKQAVFMEHGLFSAADAKAEQIAIYIECRKIVEGSGCGEIDNDGWIPCNERLPETFEPKAKAYLTTNEDGMIGVSYYHHGWSNGYESVFDIIAWQPLPEPYREEQEDEQ